MDWNDFGKFVGPILIQNAPTIGGVLGGLIPLPGGSMIGQEAGQILANVFGTPNDPNAIANAIQNDPNAAAKITAAETEAAAKWPALATIAQAKFASNAQQAQTINATMQAELAKGQPWYAWRNLYGYGTVSEVGLFSFALLYAVVFDAMIFKRMVDSFSFLLSWYSLRMGLLGYVHNQITQEKVAAATGQPQPSLVSSVVKAIKGK